MQTLTNRQKLEEFISAHQSDLVRLANREARNAADAPDIVQEALIVITCQVNEGRWLVDFDSPEALTRARGIVFNLCRGLERTTCKHRQLDIERQTREGQVVACDDSSRLADGTHVDARWHESPEFELLLQEALDKVRSGLNDRETGLFEVCFIYKLKAAEIKLLFDLSHNAYKSARRRLVVKLTDVLASMKIDVPSYLAWLARRKAKRCEAAMRRTAEEESNSISEDQQV